MIFPASPSESGLSRVKYCTEQLSHLNGPKKNERVFAGAVHKRIVSCSLEKRLHLRKGPNPPLIIFSYFYSLPAPHLLIPNKSPHTGGHQDWCEACLTWIRSELMTELELYIELMTVYLYDNFLFLRQILTLTCQITSKGYFSGNFRSPGGSCQLWLAHPCSTWP